MIGLFALLEVAAEEPDGFLVDLDASDEEVFGLAVARIGGDFAGFDGGIDDDFVRNEDRGGEVFGAGAAGARCFGNSGHLSQTLDATFGVFAELTDPLGDVIDGDEEFLILSLEHLVKGEEIGALDIPVSEVKLSEEAV